MKLCLHHYQSYYNSVKRDLKNHACLAIEGVAISIENNTEYLYHYKSIDITAFDFIGNSIVEAANFGLKEVDVTVSTNINIDKSALTQIKLSKTHDLKNTSTYCVMNLEIMA